MYLDRRSPFQFLFQLRDDDRSSLCMCTRADRKERREKIVILRRMETRREFNQSDEKNNERRKLIFINELSQINRRTSFADFFFFLYRTREEERERTDGRYQLLEFNSAVSNHLFSGTWYSVNLIAYVDVCSLSSRLCRRTKLVLISSFAIVSLSLFLSSLALTTIRIFFLLFSPSYYK